MGKHPMGIMVLFLFVLPLLIPADVSGQSSVPSPPGGAACMEDPLAGVPLAPADFSPCPGGLTMEDVEKAVFKAADVVSAIVRNCGQSLGEKAPEYRDIVIRFSGQPINVALAGMGAEFTSKLGKQAMRCALMGAVDGSDLDPVQKQAWKRSLESIFEAQDALGLLRDLGNYLTLDAEKRATLNSLLDAKVLARLNGAEKIQDRLNGLMEMFMDKDARARRALDRATDALNICDVPKAQKELLLGQSSGREALRDLRQGDAAAARLLSCMRMEWEKQGRMGYPSEGPLGREYARTEQQRQDIQARTAALEGALRSSGSECLSLKRQTKELERLNAEHTAAWARAEEAMAGGGCDTRKVREAIDAMARVESQPCGKGLLPPLSSDIEARLAARMDRPQSGVWEETRVSGSKKSVTLTISGDRATAVIGKGTYTGTAAGGELTLKMEYTNVGQITIISGNIPTTILQQAIDKYHPVLTYSLRPVSCTELKGKFDGSFYVEWDGEKMELVNLVRDPAEDVVWKAVGKP
jgi:hypothetical protein